MSDERTHEDAFNLLCGKLLGEGIHRKVFECRLRPDLVVKVEDDGGSAWRNFSNVKESAFWTDHADAHAISKWLAPHRYLSPDGRIALQDRVEPISHLAVLPTKLPGFLSDLKRENFGWLNGALVCVDYAWTVPTPNTRLRSISWD